MVTATNVKASDAPARAGIILLTLIAGAVVANVNTSISNVALPAIGKALTATDTQKDNGLVWNQ